MNETIAVAEDTIEIDNPQILYGKLSVGIGITVILIGLIVFVLSLNDEDYILLFLSLITIVLGFSKLVSGGFALKKLWVPLHAPKEYIDTNMLINSVKAGEIDIYKVNRSLSTELLRLFGSKNIYYMRGDVKNIAGKASDRSVKYSLLIILLIILLSIEIVDISTSFYIFTIIVLLSGIIANFIFSLGLIPKKTPSAYRAHKTEDIQGGHPKKAFRILIDGLKHLKYDYPKRFIGNEPDSTIEGVQNTGITNGFALIETQPLPIENQNIPSAQIALYAGYALWVLGILFMLTKSTLSSIYLGDFVFPITGILMVFMGDSLIKDSHVLFNQFYFKSNVISTEIKGEFYQSAVGVGKGIQDSLQSERKGVLSDIRFNHYIATVISVCHTLENNRNFISFEKNAHIEDELDELINYVQSQKKPDLEVHGINFAEQSASNLVQQNLVLSNVNKEDLPKLGSNLNRQNLLIKEDQDDESMDE
ncbi:MAG: hypothetical protein SCH39_04700 [Methanosarcinales archaeon]|nr:hypothetical protein [Methanosarcinales archaeon]